MCMTTAILVLARTLHFGSAMMLFALPFFMLVILRPVFSADTRESYPLFCLHMTKWLGVALILEAGSGAVWFWIVAAQMSNHSPWSVLDAADLNTVLWQSEFGQLWLVRAVVGVTLGGALYFVSQRKTLSPPKPCLLNGFVIIISGCLLITLAWAGHAAVGVHHQILHLLTNTQHLLIGAIWPTGLIPMAYFLWHINKGNRPSPAHREIATVKRFSQASLAAVLILLVTGFLNGWLMIGSWGNLVATAYGRLLLCKVFVVAIMIGVGAFNRFRLMPRIHDAPIMFQILGRTILAESCLALVVLFIVGMHT